jgi:hypothetical protein
LPRCSRAIGHDEERMLGDDHGSLQSADHRTPSGEHSSAIDEIQKRVWGHDLRAVGIRSLIVDASLYYTIGDLGLLGQVAPPLPDIFPWHTAAFHCR